MSSGSSRRSWGRPPEERRQPCSNTPLEVVAAKTQGTFAEAPESTTLAEESAPAPAALDFEQPPDTQASYPSPPDRPWDPSDTLPSSCVGNAELIPLGVVDDGSPWRVADPESRYLVWTDEWSSGEGRHERWFRWSDAQGITLIGDYVDAYLVLPSADGTSVVGSRSVENTLGDAFRWTQVGGTTSLDFIPFRLNPAGDVIVGAGEQGLVRWSADTGSQVVDAGAPLSMLMGLAVTTTLDVIAAADRNGRAFRWTEAEGSVDLGALAGPWSRPAIHHISANGDVIVGSAYDAQNTGRPIRWAAANGFRELGAPADTPDDASVAPHYMSADGRVIVGQVSAPDASYSYPFRWTEDAGFQELLPREQTSYAQYLSPSGEVVIGDLDGSGVRGFRWTEATGLQEIDYPGSWFGIAAGGDLLVGTNAQGPFVHTFGKLAGTQPEIVSLAPSELLPEGWSQPRLEGISEDGRMLFGRAEDPDGRRRLWVLHPSERCSNP